MDEFIDKIVADTGVDPAVVRTAVIIILKFLQHESSSDKVSTLIDALPGAREAMAESSAGGTAGLMGVFNDLSSAGLGMMQLQAVGRSFGEHARAKVGSDTVDDIVASVPGLSQFV
jgi:hypothetical protein